MNADRHFEKGEAFEASQAKLDSASNAELVVDGCYYAAHHFVLAGTEWRGVAHKQSHPHGKNPELLNDAGAPEAVSDAWDALERLRSGYVYGGRTAGTGGADARDALATIKTWVTAARP